MQFFLLQEYGAPQMDNTQDVRLIQPWFNLLQPCKDCFTSTFDEVLAPAMQIGLIPRWSNHTDVSEVASHFQTSKSKLTRLS